MVGHSPLSPAMIHLMQYAVLNRYWELTSVHNRGPAPPSTPSPRQPPCRRPSRLPTPPHALRRTKGLGTFLPIVRLPAWWGTAPGVAPQPLSRHVSTCLRDVRS